MYKQLKTGVREFASLIKMYKQMGSISRTPPICINKCLGGMLIHPARSAMLVEGPELQELGEHVGPVVGSVDVLQVDQAHIDQLSQPM